MELKLLESHDVALLDHVAPGMFDYPIEKQQRDAFLKDPNHFLAVCIDGQIIVGMVSSVRYFHPDKKPELWINEVGVAPSHQRRGIAASLIKLTFEQAKKLGCHEAWVLSEETNEPAKKLYSSLGGKDKPQILFSFEL